jgi:hypothetical protein
VEFRCLSCFLYFQEPRLLGEIHISLLKSIIKDIEDVARTPATSLGPNQNSAANPGGGHPQIVEGVSLLCCVLLWQFDLLNYAPFFHPKLFLASVSGICMGF